MKENETIVEMITRFTDIVNGLEALGKTYKKSEKVMKILKSLPSKWHTKVTAIQEAKGLTKLPMEELIGSLMTYEINLAKKLQEGEDKTKKNIALKATTKEEEDVEEEKPSEEDDDLALIIRKLNKYMRSERFRGRNFTSRRDLSKKESSSHRDKEKWEEKRDLVCFKCKRLGHIKYDCPLYKSEAKRRMKKAMMATWSESEESSEEENEKKVANMCFMAIDDLNEGSKKDKWFLDSGCSRHMTGDESKFAFLTKRKRIRYFGDNAKGRIIGQGNIDRRQQEEIGEDPKKEESPLALPSPQQVQGESSQDLPKDWKFVINHPQDQIIEFSKCMHSEFEMSMMGELNFFLGLQIKQLKEGTFINQAKYIRDLLKRFNMEEAKTMKTPMSSSIKLDKDEKGKSIDSTMYRGMIGSLLYLTTSRPDIIYLKETMDIGLWYPKGDNFELIGFSDADFAGCKVERKALVALVIS
ncbi:Retrovirus-related Pol polyprotein from transposon RE1 [Vitis vinifera]|uniref:Retrovirus-related Pol polyprotein from transposon RE1 n=1 Tax=Vitis vinifera TaxID=29760 RepID=A0A438HC60_VITVI|nr:Retrovirus-related Pol polyprotein from transposon RE1 [Vitis vinifera]